MPLPILFDAVLFDLDGTLAATDRFWIQAAKAGARRAFDELGLDRELPTGEEWMALVGLPLAEGFERLFADLSPEARACVLEACEEEEERRIRAGAAAWMPGAETVVRELHAAGHGLGIASNCSAGYLQQMGEGLGLGELVREAWCLDSPGISNKADMIDRILARLGTRSAVFVGDRVGDRDAAWANGLPHVHCAFGFAQASEQVEAEGVIEDMGALPELLRGRARWVAAGLAEAGVSLEARGPLVLGVTGAPLAGKSLFARDAARLLRQHGQPATVVPLEAFARSDAAPGGEPREDPLGDLDLGRLDREVLEPHAAGRPVALRLPPESEPRQVAPEDVVVLEGPHLLDPGLQRRLDRVLWLDCAEEVLWRRARGREGRERGVTALEDLHGRIVPEYEAHRSRYAPERLADAVLDASNPLGRTAGG